MFYIFVNTCVCLLKCLDAQFSMSVSEDGFLRVNSGKMPQLALGIIFLAFRLASNWAQAPRSSDLNFDKQRGSEETDNLVPQNIYKVSLALINTQVANSRLTF